MTASQIIKKNNVKVIGSGEKTLLLAHGFGCDQNMFRFLTPEFTEDYKIVLFDYIGCGASDVSYYKKAKYKSLTGYAHDILDICEALNLQEVTFIGHSVSCVIGILAHNIDPRFFSKMVLICPSPKYINDNDYIGGFEKQDLEELIEVMENNHSAWASFLAPVVMKNEDQPDLVKELEESFKNLDPVISQNFAKTTFFSDNREDLKKIKIPTLILQCSDDSIAPESVGNFVHKEIKNSILKCMNATGHCPHMTHPKETIEAIKPFVNEFAY